MTNKFCIVQTQNPQMIILTPCCTCDDNNTDTSGASTDFFHKKSEKKTHAVNSNGKTDVQVQQATDKYDGIILRKTDLQTDANYVDITVQEYNDFMLQKDFNLSSKYQTLKTQSLHFTSDATLQLELKPCIGFKYGSFIGWYRTRSKKDSEFGEVRPILYFADHRDFANATQALTQIHSMNSENNTHLAFDLSYVVEHGEDKLSYTLQNLLLINRLTAVNILLKYCHYDEYNEKQGKFEDNYSHEVRGIANFIDRDVLEQMSEQELENVKVLEQQAKELMDVVLTEDGQKYYTELLNIARKNSNPQHLIALRKKYNNKTLFHTNVAGTASVTSASLIAHIKPTILTTTQKTGRFRNKKHQQQSRKQMVQQHNNLTEEMKYLLVTPKIVNEEFVEVEDEPIKALVVHLSMPKLPLTLKDKTVAPEVKPVVQEVHNENVTPEALTTEPDMGAIEF